MSERNRPGPLVGGPNPQERRGRRSMTRLRKMVYAVIAPIGVAVLRLLWWTYRIDLEIDHEAQHFDGESDPAVIALWHDSIFICAWYLRLLASRGVRVTYLVSPSADGELAVRLLDVMGWRSVRGSATRSGVKALHGMYRAIAKRRESPVLVPDGPQGPSHECKLGAVLLARLAGVEILPIGGAARSARRLNTWDRLQIPWPFTRVAITVGKPFRVDPESDDEQNEAQRQALEAELNELTNRSGSRIGLDGRQRAR